MERDSLPLLPSTVILFLSILTLTPEGTGMGINPIRDTGSTSANVIYQT
jgi:hypothetical protein